MNVVILKGRLCGDPEVRYSQANGEQMAIARYRLAVSRSKKDEADFINCVAFGRVGEFAEKYLKKGQEVLIQGRIQTGSYQNKDGQKVYATDVIVEKHDFCGAKQEGSGMQPSAPDSSWQTIPENITDNLPFK